VHGAACQTPHAARTFPPLCFEREPGVSARPVPRGYRRREPEHTALYGIVREHIETLLAESRAADDSGTGYPRFVEHEFRRYLDCGILSRGFARLRCPSCGFERLVAFSCKGRFCPSCWARRTADIAAHLTDRVFPEAPYRQWVLTFPWAMRFPLAVDGSFLADMLRAFTRTVFAWQRLRGRRMGLRDGETGSVTFVQRFGGILNLNPHFHTVMPDGLFVPGAGGARVFALLPPPTDEDIRTLAERLAQRLSAIAARRADDQADPFADQVMVRSSAGEAVHLPVRSRRDPDDEEERKPLCARVNGFSLHAGRTVDAHDRAGLERLCRYGLRAPFSGERLSIDTDGNVRYRLHRPWPTPDGRTELVLEPLAFLRRMVALIPAPYLNLVRYHGVFANRSRFRTLLPLPPPRGKDAPPVVLNGEPPQPQQESSAAGQTGAPVPSVRPRRLAWASLLRRALHVDALACARCAKPMLVLAFISDPAVIRKILTHLGLPAEPPPLAPARRPRDEDAFFHDDFPGETAAPPAHGFPEFPRSSRAPP